MSPECPICNAGSLMPAIQGVRDWEYNCPGHYSFNTCTRCGVMVLHPMPGLEQLKAAYPPDYHGFHTSGRGVVSFLYRIVDLLRFQEYHKFVGGEARLLDVGCASAPYFDALKKQCPGMDLMGVEFKEDIAEQGRRAGRNILTGTLQDIPAHELFDIIIMNNLIEHVIDPVAELRSARAHLKSGGYIVLETPNTASWDLALSGRFWGGLHVPRHTHLFSPSSLDALARNSGFEIVARYFLLNTDHWALSIQNYLVARSPGLIRLHKGRAWFFKYLLFAFLPLNVLQRVLKRTGAVKFILRSTQ